MTWYHIYAAQRAPVNVTPREPFWIASSTICRLLHFPFSALHQKLSGWAWSEARQTKLQTSHWTTPELLSLGTVPAAEHLHITMTVSLLLTIPPLSWGCSALAAAALAMAAAGEQHLGDLTKPQSSASLSVDRPSAKLPMALSKKRANKC